jgi:hypothetical protein
MRLTRLIKSCVRIRACNCEATLAGRLLHVQVAWLRTPRSSPVGSFSDASLQFKADALMQRHGLTR